MANLTKIGPDKRPVGETPVCVFHRATTPGKGELPLELRGQVYQKESTRIQILTLSEFLELGEQYADEIRQIRQTTDKNERSRLKKDLLPAGCISCQVKTRMAGVRKEDKIEAYNSLIVLDFDHLEDITRAKQDLAQLPFIWYIGLSVSGEGLFAIVPVDTDDWRDQIGRAHV